jgi:acylphosphatase
MPTKHVLIKGKVQGVFYRASAKKKAEGLAITGWIKNTYGGDVEALISGTSDSLEKFIAWCYEGPADAEVSEVIINEAEEQSFQSFTILR